MSAAALGAAGPAGEATHRQARTIPFADVKERYGLASFVLNDEGNLLVCLARLPELRVVSPAGKVLATWKLPFVPHSLCAGSEGTVYVGGGNSQVARLDKTGQVLKTLDLPAGKSGYQRVTALAVDGKDLFVGFRNEGGFTIYRYDLEFGGSQQVVGGLRGCCGQLHFVARAGSLYVADNTRHRVARYDRDGKPLGTWGQRSRDDSDGEGFGSCCNPMNVCFSPGGDIYTSESGGRIKRFSPEGKFLGIVASYDGGSGCKHVAVAAARDGRQVFVIDVAENVIRVLEAPAPPAAGQPAAAAAAPSR